MSGQEARSAASTPPLTLEQRIGMLVRRCEYMKDNTANDIVAGLCQEVIDVLDAVEERLG